VRSFFKISVAISLLLSACGGGDPEAQVVGAFFSAVQKGDRAGAERVSLAPFADKAESWEIVERGQESEAPFQLADLEAQLKTKRDEVEAQRAENATFINDNTDTYEAYKAKYAEDPSAPFQGELLAFHEELQGRQGRLAQLRADSDQLALDVEALKNAATLSLSTPVEASFEGQIKVKPLQVRVNDGSAVKTYTVVLHRYDLVDKGQNRTPTARWIIAEIQSPS
jgi:ABC-type Na+ efflux pump permease subunit